MTFERLRPWNSPKFLQKELSCPVCTLNVATIDERGLVSLGIADGVLSAQARLIGRKWSSGSQRVFGSEKRCCGYSFASWQRVVLLSLWFLRGL